MTHKHSIILPKLSIATRRTLFGAIFLCFIFSGSYAGAASDIDATSSATSTATTTPALPTLAQTEAAVRSYFADIPIMISVAHCESTFRQYTNTGTPLRGHKNYIGVFQISEKVHAKNAKTLGMDIYTLDGNMAYAKYLYQQSGTVPWAGCVNQADVVTPSTTTTATTTTEILLNHNLKLGETYSQVKTLQQLLNTLGFTITKSGAGSPGHETTMFGAMTRAAVQRFQCAKKITCSGTESTTGYGYVGPHTRTILLQSIQSK